MRPSMDALPRGAGSQNMSGRPRCFNSCMWREEEEAWQLDFWWIRRGLNFCMPARVALTFTHIKGVASFGRA